MAVSANNTLLRRLELKAESVVSFTVNEYEQFKLIEKKRIRKYVKMFLLINEGVAKTLLRQKNHQAEI